MFLDPSLEKTDKVPLHIQRRTSLDDLIITKCALTSQRIFEMPRIFLFCYVMQTEQISNKLRTTGKHEIFIL